MLGRFLLPGIIGGQFPERFDILVNPFDAAFERFQVLLIASQHITALPGFGLGNVK
jgi:hypothetical protein